MSCAQASRRFHFALLSILVAAALVAPLAGRLDAQQDERSVRAAFVYNMTRYVVWPAPDRNLNLCVSGGGNMGPALKFVVNGKISGERTIRVLLQPAESEFRRCDIFYWSGGFGSRVHPLLEKFRGTPTLTIGEDDAFVREGGMIAFVRSGDSIQIEVNLDSVKAGGLNISSKLLDLALIIRSGK